MPTAPLESLPIDVLSRIGQALAPNFGEDAWHDGATTAASAASCMIAGNATWHIGVSAYMALLSLHNAPDASVIPDGVTPQSTVSQLRDALRKWRVGPLSGKKADLWARIAQAYSPRCPVPRTLRHRVSALRYRAPVAAYLVCDNDGCRSLSVSSIRDVHAESLRRFGSLQGWTAARSQSIKEKEFFAVHCQPYYDEEVRRYIDDWEEAEESYYGYGGGGDYWRQRERYRDGYEDESEEIEAVTVAAMKAVKPRALQRWVGAIGGPCRAIVDPRLPASFRQDLCMSLAEEEHDRWLAKGASTYLDDVPHLSLDKRRSELRTFSRNHFLANAEPLDDSKGWLEAACTPERFAELHTAISTWTSSVREAHRHVQDATKHLHGPTLTQLYPSMAELLAVDARLTTDRDAARKDFEKLVERERVQEQRKKRLADDLVECDPSVRYRCAMCPNSERTFEAGGLRCHAYAKHGMSPKLETL